MEEESWVPGLVCDGKCKATTNVLVSLTHHKVTGYVQNVLTINIAVIVLHIASGAPLIVTLSLSCCHSHCTYKLNVITSIYKVC